MSIIRPVFFRKSAPIIGLVTEAIRKVWLKTRRNTRLIRTSLVPNTAMVEPLAVDMIWSALLFCFLKKDEGMTDTSEPESIKNLMDEIGSLMNRRH